MTMKFRETLWFKLGDSAPSAEHAEEEASVPLPIEDRYSGAVTARETSAYGLHTGTTEYIKLVDPNAVADDDVSMKTLVREMKHSKQRLFAIGASVAAACTMFTLYLV